VPGQLGVVRQCQLGAAEHGVTETAEKQKRPELGEDVGGGQVDSVAGADVLAVLRPEGGRRRKGGLGSCSGSGEGVGRGSRREASRLCGWSRRSRSAETCER
jgi:hypothetical protein